MRGEAKHGVYIVGGNGKREGEALMRVESNGFPPGPEPESPCAIGREAMGWRSVTPPELRASRSRPAAVALFVGAE